MILSRSASVSDEDWAYIDIGSPLMRISMNDIREMRNSKGMACKSRRTTY
jgi:hypothetical protein